MSSKNYLQVVLAIILVVAVTEIVIGSARYIESPYDYDQEPMPKAARRSDEDEMDQDPSASSPDGSDNDENEPGKFLSLSRSSSKSRVHLSDDWDDFKQTSRRWTL